MVDCAEWQVLPYLVCPPGYLVASCPEAAGIGLGLLVNGPPATLLQDALSHTVRFSKKQLVHLVTAVTKDATRAKGTKAHLVQTLVDEVFAHDASMREKVSAAYSVRPPTVEEALEGRG